MKKKMMFLACALAAGMSISSAACAQESTGSGIMDDIQALTGLSWMVSVVLPGGIEPGQIVSHLIRKTGPGTLMFPGFFCVSFVSLFVSLFSKKQTIFDDL